MRPLKLIFAGTPEFAAAHLRALLDSSNHTVCAVYTQPDRPSGRGKKLSASPVKQVALDSGLAIYQPHTLRDAATQRELQAHAADIMVVVAYGLLLPVAVLNAPRLGCINVHASLLPRWRGAAPIHRAIEAGDSKTGVTIMQMDEGLDTGCIVRSAECAIEPTDTTGSLLDKLAGLGVRELLAALQTFQRCDAEGCPVSVQVQDNAQATYANKINKSEARLDWQLPASVLANRVRAFNPFPVAYTEIAGTRLRVWRASALGAVATLRPGTLFAVNDALAVACGEGALLLDEVQLAGRQRMSIAQLLRGHAGLLSAGMCLE